MVHPRHFREIMKIVKTLKFNVTSIRGKLLWFTLLIILAFSLFITSYYIRTDELSDENAALMYNVVVLNDVFNNLENTRDDLQEYLTDKTASSFNEYTTSYTNLSQNINEMPITFATEKELLAYSDLRGMMLTLSFEMDNAVAASRSRDHAEALSCYENTSEIIDNMQNSISYLVLEYLSHSENLYFALTQSTSDTQIIMLVALVVISIIMILNVLAFSRELLEPLQKLSSQAKQISKDPNKKVNIELKNEDEFGVLANGFNMMSASINTYIEELKEKSAIENHLKTKELENLQMKNLLNESELMALQSQINPHFLFNTLSCVAQQALMEGAADTYELMLCTSDMLRYNLGKLDKVVTLEAEVENLERYFFIQKARFGEKINLELSVSEETKKIHIPLMTLQPIVENAVIHGLEPSEERGIIKLDIERVGEQVKFIVEDNGIGMEHVDSHEFFYGKNDTNRKKGHTTGIGVKNVVSRLNLFYNDKCEFHISSVPGNGTKVVICIPYENRGL